MQQVTQRKSVVVVGGGTGTHTILRGLKKYQDNITLTAIVTMADSGGSTGRLRDEFGQLPVGDVRMALAALASDGDEHEALVRQLFMHRFDRGDGLRGHNVGNLLLVALTDLLGSEEAAIRAAARVLRVEGQVIPVTTESVHLSATYANGTTVVGEHDIDEPSAVQAASSIVDLAITPQATVNENAREAILSADLIVLGPGDLYTSILANCVVGGVKEALQASTATMVYVCNLMTKVGQTTGMGAAEHIAEIARYCGRHPDVVLVNTGSIPDDLLTKYAAAAEYPVHVNCHGGRCVVIADDFTAKESVRLQSGDVLRRSLVRHDPDHLAAQIVGVLSGTERLLK